MIKLQPLLLVMATLLIHSCTNFQKLADPAAHPKIKKWYSASIADAAYPAEEDISYILTPLREDNPDLIWKTINGERYVLAVSWKAEKKYYKNDETSGYYNTGNYPIWVTLAPYAQQQCQEAGFGRREGVSLRLKQLLGLPPNTTQKWFIEFWVRPADLFRPCPDAETNDNHCITYFPDDVTEAHKDWIDAYRSGSYYGKELYSQYPWTQLGYTYDWNPRNRSHVGLSEYVIRANADIIVKETYTTEAYCNRANP
jgi:hypothetical protein